MTPYQLIVDVMMAADWSAAYRLTAATMPLADEDGLPLLDKSWTARRRACLDMAAIVRDELRSPSRAAWTFLGAEPAGYNWRTREGHDSYGRILEAIADAIVEDPARLHDPAFRAAVSGWRFLERAGSDGEDDLVVAARRYGDMAGTDADEMLAWAQRWRTGAERLRR